jgi:hypothetical protein
MSDALSLIADTGAMGGLTGRDASSTTMTVTIPDPSPSPTYDPEAYARGVAAQAQNRKFASLSIMDYCEPSRNLSWADGNGADIIRIPRRFVRLCTRGSDKLLRRFLVLRTCL